jgi:hypothetical protein
MWTDASCAGVKLDGLQGVVAGPTHAHESILNAAPRVRPEVLFACAREYAAHTAPNWLQA